MWAAVTVGVLSLIAVLVMIRSAGASGFGVLVVPLALLEILFLGAVFLLWRTLTSGEEDAHEIERRPVAPRREPTAPRRQASARPEGRVAPDAGARTRLSALADWWFNGLRDPRRH